MSRQYTGEWVVSSLLAERAERFADEVAVASEDGAAHLRRPRRARRTRRRARSPRSASQPGDRIATMLPTGNDYLAAWHAVVWLGAIEVPVNVEYRGSFLEHILQRLRRDRPRRPRALARTASARSSSPDVRHLVVVGERARARRPPGVDDARVRRLPRRTTRVPRHASGELDLTYIMYTSGTTGRSKGAVHNNRSSIHYIMPFVEGLDLERRRRLLLDVPPLPPDGALGLHDLRALGRQPRRAPRRVLGERLLGRHPRVRRDLDGLLRRRHPLPLAEPALAAATATTGSPARSARAPRRS